MSVWREIARNRARRLWADAFEARDPVGYAVYQRREYDLLAAVSEFAARDEREEVRQAGPDPDRHTPLGEA